MKKAFPSSARSKFGVEARELLVGNELTADPSLIAEAFSRKFVVQSECGSHPPPLVYRSPIAGLLSSLSIFRWCILA